MQNVVVWAGLIGSFFGIATSFIAIGSIYRSSIRKGYAAERDFQHLQRNYEALIQNMNFLTKNFERDFADIRKENDQQSDRIIENQIEIKALLLSNLGIKPKSSDG